MNATDTGLVMTDWAASRLRLADVHRATFGMRYQISARSLDRCVSLFLPLTLPTSLFQTPRRCSQPVFESNLYVFDSQISASIKCDAAGNARVILRNACNSTVECLANSLVIRSLLAQFGRVALVSVTS